VAITSAGGTVTLGMTDYEATFTFDEDSGWYLEKESYTWEEGASGEESADDSSDTE